MRARRRKPVHHIPGEEGTWIFILGDMSVFAFIFCTFVVYRSGDVDLFNASSQQLTQEFGVINTLLLLTSSLAVITGMRAIHTGGRALASRCFLAAIACGFGFSMMKFLEYGDKVDRGITPTTNDFWMYFYIMTGLHFLHLLLGMAVLAYLWKKSRKAVLTVKEFAFVEGGACFWHMVDVLWIVLFPLLYLMR